MPSSDALLGRVEACVAAIRTRTELRPAIGFVLGSGLGRIAARAEGTTIATSTLPHWPRSTVPGHAGVLVLGTWGRVPVAILSGRSHAYEGYGLDEITLPHRVLRGLGISTLILTNAAGSMNPDLAPGGLMLVRDHVNRIGTRGLLAPSELSQLVRDGRPSRAVYSDEVRGTLRDAALVRRIPLFDGVLFGGLGPAYETAAEVRMARKLGADAACMSTVHEAALGSALGLRVGAISCITNYATGLATQSLTHDEVTVVADRIAEQLEALFEEAVPRLAV